MTDEKEGIWNGGKTRINKEEARIFRQQEDEYDIIFSEIKTREELVKREKMMKEEANYKEIQMNHTLSNDSANTKPMHELYKGINKQINNFEKWKNDKTPWLKMAGPNRDKR